MSYVIIKQVKVEGKELSVIVLDELGEVLSFKDRRDAEDYRRLFQINSDSNHSYILKQVSGQ